MNAWKGILIGAILLLLGLAAGYFLFNRNETIKEAEKTMQIAQDSIVALNIRLRDYRENESKLNDSIEAVNSRYDSISRRELTENDADSLQREEIRKGVARFGRPSIRQAQAALAALFGNQAFDNLEIVERKYENEKKVSAVYSGIVQYKDTIINEQELIIKVQNREAIKRNVGWFFGGTLFGFLASLLFLL